MKKHSFIQLFLISGILLVFISCSKKNSTTIHINDIQVIGSHNSYKKAIQSELLQMLHQETSNPYEELQYSHIPIREQLEKYGMRNLEIDVVYDPSGGRYAHPLGNELLKKNGIDPLPYNTDSLMNKPGFKVMHVPDIDFRSNCSTLKRCLTEIRNWSDSHPEHLPVCIIVNTKSDQINRPGFTRLLPFTKKALDSLEKEILSVMPEDRIIKPDDVRGKYKTLETAVLTEKWPELKDARGKFIFVLDEYGQKRRDYLEGHPSLKGRLMFISSPPGNPEAAFMVINDPVKNQEKIKDLVKKGYLVRTRADADTREARKDDLTRFRAALSSGAQYISTDYYKADPKIGTGYKTGLPEGPVARCNPVTVTKDCSERLKE
jgi:hypothetical protein